MSKTAFLVAVLVAMLVASSFAQAQRLPNVIILFADDLGYGDLGCYGHPTIRTPHLDQMASEGMRFTQFYSAANLCTPSRAALLTGRLPIRSGMYLPIRSDTRTLPRVLTVSAAGGLPASEITIAEALKTKGYATACIGKWHLGHLPKHLPMKHGFDSHFGLPYSNDMEPTPLLRGEKVIEEPAVQETLTRRYTEEAIQFIRVNKDKPFFLYLAHTFPHLPLHASDSFRGKSRRGLYGDVVEELDWSTGEILQTLRDLGLAEHTLMFFTSDNGPSSWKGDCGSAGLLRGCKARTWEGGHRVPGIAWWPGRIKSGQTTHAIASTMDLFTTSLALAGVSIPNDRVIDGVNLVPVLLGKATDRQNDDSGGAKRVIFFYHGNRLMAVRKGPWKMHMAIWLGNRPEKRGIKIYDPPQLYHLDHDPSERYNVAKENSKIIEALRKEIERHQANLKPAESQLVAQLPENDG